MHLDPIRLDVSAKLDRKQRSELGQFMTPSSVADFMAGLFPAPASSPIRLLDAGAGIGSLTSAFLERWGHGGVSGIEATVFEIDPVLRERLAETLAHYRHTQGIKAHIHGADFIEAAVNWLQFQEAPRFTHGVRHQPWPGGWQTP